MQAIRHCHFKLDPRIRTLPRALDLGELPKSMVEFDSFTEHGETFGW